MFEATLARIAVLRRILSLFNRQEKIRLIGLVVMMVGGAGLEVIGIGAVTAFIALVAQPELAATHPTIGWLLSHFGDLTSVRAVTWAGVALFLVFLGKNAYLGYLAYRQVRFAYNKEARLARQVLAAYLQEPYLFFLQRNSAQLMRNVTHEVSHVITGIVLPGLTILSELVVLVFVLGMLASVEPIVALVVGAILGATGLIFVQSVKPILARAGHRRAISSESRIKWVNQALGSIKEVKLLGREGFFVDAFDQAAQRYARAGLTANAVNNLPRLIMETVAVAALLVAVVIGLYQGKQLQSILPMLALFGLAAMRIMPSVNRIAPAVNQMRFWLPAIDAVHGALRSATAARSEAVAYRTEEPDGEAGATFLGHELAVQGLWFKYPTSTHWAVQGISLKIARGSSVAFMGPSGAGKSTLVDLILGLLSPDEGQILADGRPVGEFRWHWQRHIGYVPQSIYLLDDTVRRNVALGLPDEAIDDDQVWKVLRQARLADVVKRMANDLGTMIGERGIRLSGGERQRIGIARALYRNPELLVFDEATSALDGQTERDIADTIRGIAGARTVLIVAHRVSTIQSCDLIFFLDQGRLVDQGRFSQLLAGNAAFRAIAGSLDREPEDPAQAQGGPASPASSVTSETP